MNRIYVLYISEHAPLVLLVFRICLYQRAKNWRPHRFWIQALAPAFFRKIYCFYPFLELSDEERKELILHVFKRLVVGGGACQYEDDMAPYLNTTKLIYKDLVCSWVRACVPKLKRSLFWLFVCAFFRTWYAHEFVRTCPCVCKRAHTHTCVRACVR